MTLLQCSEIVHGLTRWCTGNPSDRIKLCCLPLPPSVPLRCVQNVHMHTNTLEHTCTYPEQSHRVFIPLSLWPETDQSSFPPFPTLYVPWLWLLVSHPVFTTSRLKTTLHRPPLRWQPCYPAGNENYVSKSMQHGTSWPEQCEYEKSHCLLFDL